MKELTCGLWFAGLVAWPILGFMPGVVLIIIGCIPMSWKLVKEKQAAKAAESWRKQYPSYKY